MTDYLVVSMKGYKVRISLGDLWTFVSRRWHVSLSSDGRPYLRAASGSREYFHRVVCPEGDVTDHRNGDTLDNRRENLRPASRSENALNCRPRKDGTGHRGVSPDRGRFRVRITVNGNRVSIGTFKTLEEASKAYEEASIVAHGAFSPAGRSRYGV